ncbi:CoA transferase [Burkholderia anthina]|uniref:CoA transferase n=1 Tax=Burkholderia anthina TaxID=179879 RepID=UPI00158CA57C|nr:CoA transferase [Burkholderia anthina]
MTNKDEYAVALSDLIRQIGLDGLSLPPARFVGSDPNLPGPHKLSLAASVALALHGTAASALWHERTKRFQNVTIPIAIAHFSLFSGLLQSINGHSMSTERAVSTPVSGLFETADKRWIYLMAPYPKLRDGMLTLLDCANNSEAVARAVKKWAAFDLEHRISERGLAGAVVRSREEWKAHEQGIELANSPLIEIIKLSDGPPIPLPHGDKPMGGIRVLDFTHVLAGPNLSRTLAEHGANVLHVGSPCYPDPMEFLLDTGWGKKSAYFDYRQRNDVGQLENLINTTDVFVQSWRPEALAKNRLGPEDLAAKRTGIVYASINAFGFTGPWRNRKGFEQLGQAVTGVAHEEGRGNGMPCLVPTTLLNDYLAAYFGAAGVMAALKRRALEGGSYHVRTSLTGCSMWLQSLGQRLPEAGARVGYADKVLIEENTPFGRLRHLPPICQMSETPCSWDLPPSPPGAHTLEW